MSDDIVNRLRTWLYETPVCMEAADAIERLTAENERLRAALAEIANTPDEADEWDGRDKFRESREIALKIIANQQQTPQSFVEAKKERDDGWPGEF